MRMLVDVKAGGQEQRISYVKERLEGGDWCYILDQARCW